MPDLFKEGQGTVIEGFLNSKNNIIATKVYAKHDENYMPASIKKELEKNNQWRKNYKWLHKLDSVHYVFSRFFQLYF